MQCSCSCLSICLSIYRLIYLSFCLSICLSIDLSIYRYIYVSIYLSIYLILSIYLSICKFESEAILRGFLNFWTWQRQKWSYSARLPHLIVGNIKNEAILQDFLQKWKVECRADGLVPMRFAIFPLHLSKVLGLPRKFDARSYEVLRLSRKIILANLKISCSKMQLFSGNLRPDLLTHLTHTSLVLRLPREMHLSRSSSNVPRLPSCWNCYKTFTFCSLFTRHTIPCACQAKRHLNVQKCSVPFSFWHFWLATACTFSTCQLPKVFQSWGVCTCWLGNVLRATTAWTFSTCQRPKVVWAWCALCILTSKCAPHHKGVQLFISHLARWLRTRRFSEPTFRPSRATNHWKKHSEYRLFYLFPHLHLLSSDSFSSLIFSSLLWRFSPLLFICPYCRKLTSKLPSIIFIFRAHHACVCKHFTHLPSTLQRTCVNVLIQSRPCTVTAQETADAVDRSAKIGPIHFTRPAGSWDPRCIPGFSDVFPMEVGCGSSVMRETVPHLQVSGTGNVLDNMIGVPITSSHPHHGIGLKISSEKDMLGFAGLHQHHQQSTYQFLSPWDPPHTCKVSNVSSHHELPRLCHAKSCQPEEIHFDAHPELEEFVAPKPSILPAERCKPPRNSYLSWTESWNWTPSRTGTTGIYFLAMGRCAGHAS